MNIQELQLQIKTNKFDNLYVFTGDEIAIQKIYINTISQKSNLEVQYIQEFKTIYNKLNVNDIFNTKKLYVILDDLDFIKQEKVWDNIKPNGNIIIFKYNNIDKRSKFYKQFEDKIVEFNKLSTDVLIRYIQKEIGLKETYCRNLIDICDNNYNQILLEIDKIKNMNDARLNDYNDIFIYLNNVGAFHKEISDITFDFIDKVLRRDVIAVYNLQKSLKQINESNLKLLSLLYTNFKTILLIQSCKSKDICSTTGLQYYQIKFNEDKINYYSTGELVYILRLIQKIESGIKTGMIDEVHSIDYLLVNII